MLYKFEDLVIVWFSSPYQLVGVTRCISVTELSAADGKLVSVAPYACSLQLLSSRLHLGVAHSLWLP
jgi:hypothetical protein